MDHSLFSTLSAELRNEIWYHTLFSPRGISLEMYASGRSSRCGPSHSLAIMQTCRQVRAETAGLFFFHNTFFFVVHHPGPGSADSWYQSIDNFIQGIGKHRSTALSRVVLVLGHRHTVGGSRGPEIPWSTIARLRTRLHPSTILTIDFLAFNRGVPHRWIRPSVSRVKQAGLPLQIHLPLDVDLADQLALQPLMHRDRIAVYRDHRTNHAFQGVLWAQRALPELSEILFRKITKVKSRAEGYGLKHSADAVQKMLQEEPYNYQDEVLHHTWLAAFTPSCVGVIPCGRCENLECLMHWLSRAVAPCRSISDVRACFEDRGDSFTLVRRGNCRHNNFEELKQMIRHSSEPGRTDEFGKMVMLRVKVE